MQKQEKVTHKEECQTMYWNLLQMTKKNNVLLSTFVKTLEETKQCDDIVDFVAIRKEYKTKLDNDMDGVYDGMTNHIINKNRMINLYSVWFNTEKIEKSLNIKDRFYYYVYYKYIGGFATIGGISSIGYGVKIIWNVINSLKRK